MSANLNDDVAVTMKAWEWLILVGLLGETKASLPMDFRKAVGDACQAVLDLRAQR